MLKSEGPLSNWSNLKRSNIFKNVIFPTSHRRANTRWKLISENMKCYTIFLSVQLSFLSDPSPIIESPCQPLSLSSCWILRKLLDLSKWIWQIDKWITPSYCLDLSKWYMDWLYGFVKVAKWICFDCCMDLSKLLFVFLALCQTKPSWSLTKISMLVEAPALN